MKRFKCDVLVVGGGGAALRAAIAARELDPECRVILVTKGRLGTTGTTANSCSDRMAFHATLPHTEPVGEDAWRYHADDIYRLGGRVSDYDLAVILAKKSCQAFEYLDSLGVPFVKKDGKAHQFVTDGSKYARACYTGPKTAIHIEEALVRRARELKVEVVENTMIVSLLVEDGEVAGAIGVDQADEVLLFDTPAVVLGTGGGGEVFEHNVYPPGATGDGYALALRAGASVVNMEFIQIGLSSVKTRLACSGSIMRAVPRFINDRGEEFLIKYFPEGTTWMEVHNIVFEKGASWPVSCEHASSQIDIAVFKEIMRGGSVYLDFSANPREFRFDQLKSENRQRYAQEVSNPIPEDKREISPLARLKEINPVSIQWLKDNGIDLEKGDLIEIVPAAQHFQGGVKIRERGNTQVRGLFAAGECAGGQHGANRPGGNALLDCQVFGRIAGEEAVRYAKAVLPNKKEITDEMCDGLQKESLIFKYNGMAGATEPDNAAGESIYARELKREIQKLMGRYVSIVRTYEGLSRAWQRLEELERYQVQRGDLSLMEYYECLNLLLVAKATILACMQRSESRGPHLFFASEDDLRPVPGNPDYEKYFVISYRGNELVAKAQEPVRPDNGR